MLEAWARRGDLDWYALGVAGRWGEYAYFNPPDARMGTLANDKLRREYSRAFRDYEVSALATQAEWESIMDRFRSFAAFLKKKAPAKRKVTIRRVTMKDDGSTSLSDNGRITVCVNASLPVHRQLDTLVHEWGHVLEYDKTGLHGREWGIGCSKAYEAWEEFVEQYT